MSNPLPSPTDKRHAADLGGGVVVSPETIEMLMELGGDDDPELLEELIHLYLDDSCVRVKILGDALVGGDLEAIGRSAHALKSASANIGALCFADVCREIETCANAGDSARMQELVGRGRAMHGEVEVVLRTLLGTPEGLGE
ncbi:MAG: Hpt domain-containing protein [bacterium]|nr:Hpt domain-containing protein [bacterium]